MLKYGAPTMVEMENLRQAAEACRSLRLDFLELNINFPQYLLTKLDAEELTVEAAKMKEIERSMGLTVPVNPLLRIVSLALPVVPEVKMSDLGMVNAADQTMIPLFVE